MKRVSIQNPSTTKIIFVQCNYEIIKHNPKIYLEYFVLKYLDNKNILGITIYNILIATNKFKCYLVVYVTHRPDQTKKQKPPRLYNR